MMMSLIYENYNEITMKNSYKFIVIIRHNINEYLENYSSACEGQIIATK